MERKEIKIEKKSWCKNRIRQQNFEPLIFYSPLPLYKTIPTLISKLELERPINRKTYPILTGILEEEGKFGALSKNLAWAVAVVEKQKRRKMHGETEKKKKEKMGD